MAMGHRENVNLQQVKTALEMESHEEKLHNMIRQVFASLNFTPSPLAASNRRCVFNIRAKSTKLGKKPNEEPTQSTNKSLRAPRLASACQDSLVARWVQLRTCSTTTAE
jgi:hypothetical protein